MVRSERRPKAGRSSLVPLDVDPHVVEEAFGDGGSDAPDVVVAERRPVGQLVLDPEPHCVERAEALEDAELEGIEVGDNPIDPAPEGVELGG